MHCLFLTQFLNWNLVILCEIGQIFNFFVAYRVVLIVELVVSFHKSIKWKGY